jgi:hypothetical protein
LQKNRSIHICLINTKIIHNLACFLPRNAPIFIINCPDFAPISSTLQLPRFAYGLTKDSAGAHGVVIHNQSLHSQPLVVPLQQVHDGVEVVRLARILNWTVVHLGMTFFTRENLDDDDFFVAVFFIGDDLLMKKDDFDDVFCGYEMMQHKTSLLSTSQLLGN